MNLDRVIAVRTQKTVYKDGEESVKVFGGEYSAADVLSEALCLARAAEAGIRVPEVRAAEKTDGRWAIVTEYIDGQTADALMKKRAGRCLGLRIKSGGELRLQKVTGRTGQRSTRL